MSETQALAVVPESSGDLMPVAMGKTFTAYRQLQAEIDKSMPDQIMTIQGRQFRKKGYWRAVRAAFRLKVECVREDRIERGGDWGYSVLYRAEGNNGMSADGDGVCMASEKRGHGQGTEHNVRSHAHTRAFNRAVSNLVGFGEVSAEEVERDDHPTPVQTAAVRQAAVRTAQKAADAAPVIDAEASVAEAPDHDLLGDVEPAETIPPGAAELGAVRVQDAKVLKKGEGAKGPWTLFLLKFSDGREATTFDEPTYAAGTVYLKDRSLVIADTRPSKRDATKLELVSLMKVG